MKKADLSEVEQLAILAELAGPLVHESNNFLNNLFLHMALFQDHLPEQLRADCESVRKEGRKLVHFLRQWQGQQRVSLDTSGEIELNQLMEEVVERLPAENGNPRFNLTLSSEPLWLKGATGKIKRFCYLWLQTAIEINEIHDRKTVAALAVQTGKEQDRIRLQILDVGSEISADNLAEFENENGGSAASLTMAACIAMARHLRCKILTEKDSQGKCNLVVEFS
jgi:hypothetical protein